MKTYYMIAECVGDSIYEQHTIPFAYAKREWAEYQKRILEEQDEPGITFRIRTIQLVEDGPTK